MAQFCSICQRRYDILEYIILCIILLITLLDLNILKIILSTFDVMKEYNNF